MTMPQDREAVAEEVAEQRKLDEEATKAQELPAEHEARASADEAAAAQPAAPPATG